MHNARMPVAITIRNVPAATRDELAARAAQSGRSLEEYLRGELIDLASKPDMETVLKPDMETVLGRIKARKDATGTTLSTEKILEYRDADRE